MFEELRKKRVGKQLDFTAPLYLYRSQIVEVEVSQEYLRVRKTEIEI